MIRIFWDDLTQSKQKEILAAFGDNCNYDVFPVTEITTEDDPDMGLSEALEDAKLIYQVNASFEEGGEPYEQ